MDPSSVVTPSIISALPPSANIGWGVAGKRITEELTKVALVSDIRGTSWLAHDFPVEFTLPILQAVRGVDMLPMHSHLYSAKRVGYSFAEDDVLLRHYAINAIRHFEKVVCGSTWGRDCMVRAGVPSDRVSVAIQGVDADVFKPDPERLKGRSFTIWSSAKFEYRKANDVVIRAVAVMMERHKDVRLIAAWHNPWPASEATMAQSPIIEWTGSQFDVCCQHLDMSRVELIGPEMHGASVSHINSCDVGLFPNRCEAGTNLPLMEAMSCGLPVIATTAHGHTDVTKHLLDCSTIRSTSRPIHRGGMYVADWYEPDLEEAVNNLEYFYQEWHCGGISHGYGDSNRAWMKNYTWAACAQSLLEACAQ